MDPKKIEGVLDWPVLKTMKQLQGFLGFANFYHQFKKKSNSPSQIIVKRYTMDD
jgi:hypothetical protein